MRQGVTATYLIWEGDPAESILEASASEGADVIVLGSRRRTDLRRLLLGSVSVGGVAASRLPSGGRPRLSCRHGALAGGRMARVGRAA